MKAPNTIQQHERETLHKNCWEFFAARRTELEKFGIPNEARDCNDRSLASMNGRRNWVEARNCTHLLLLFMSLSSTSGDPVSHPPPKTKKLILKWFLLFGVLFHEERFRSCCISQFLLSLPLRDELEAYMREQPFLSEEILRQKPAMRKKLFCAISLALKRDSRW